MLLYSSVQKKRVQKSKVITRFKMHKEKVKFTKEEELDKFIKYSKEVHKLKIPKEIKEELEHFKKTGIPRCSICKKPMVNAYDSKLKKINKHIWKTTCGHNKGLRLCVG